MAVAPPPGPPVKRSVTIAGHETSIALEPMFWKALEETAAAAKLPLNALIARIDAERLEQSPPANLASAIRQWLFARFLGGPQDSARE
jgi:predicted DNA-binding ribbon-helix-helix protein